MHTWVLLVFFLCGCDHVTLIIASFSLFLVSLGRGGSYLMTELLNARAAISLKEIVLSPHKSRNNVYDVCIPK